VGGILKRLEMQLTTPSQALEKLIGFINRIERLEANNYKIPRLRTEDLNKLKWEMPRISLFASIAIYNKNKERASEIIDKWRTNFLKAVELRESLYVQEGGQK
jgi:hypothetical protein